MSTHFIDPAVLKSITADYNLRAPEGSAGKWWEIVQIVGGAVRTAGDNTIAEVQFKVSEDSTTGNAMRRDKAAFFLNTEQIQGRAEVTVATQISLRVLKEIMKAVKREGQDPVAALADGSLINETVRMKFFEDEAYGKLKLQSVKKAG